MAINIEDKYREEREKRRRPDGKNQYVILPESKWKAWADDCWVDPTKNLSRSPSDGDSRKIVVIGAGFAGVLQGVHLIEYGVSPEDILLVDRAGGFGGTWYWNRYPGLMCDIESYVYLPLLEETGYMPKHKYSYGDEIRQHAERTAQKWNLFDKGLFQTEVNVCTWDETKQAWAINLTQHLKGQEPRAFSIDADFVILGTGLLTSPKIPGVPGIEDYEGHAFHTSRWDYGYTGGSPTDWSMGNLKDKSVAVVGTGATAIQVVPEVAKWAKHLYVVQRTPAGVDWRGQRETDPETWSQSIAQRKGWQQQRDENFTTFMSDPLEMPAVNMVEDAWTTAFQTCAAATGTPRAKNVNLNNLQDHIKRYHEMDLKRTNRIRDRVDSIVKNPETAASLKAWYYSWCKRPCFHDDYLPAFNCPNVKLVDTRGKGLQSVTKNGFIANGHEFKVDLIIFSTGFTVDLGKSPSGLAGFPIIGRNGMTMEEKWAQSVRTMHGVITRDFPNCFFAGPSQAALGPSQVTTLNVLAKHIAYVISTALKKAAAQGAKGVAVEPLKEAEEAWRDKIAAQSLPAAIGMGCTPSYYNGEGSLLQVTDPQEQLKLAEKTVWTAGIYDFAGVLNGWRENGDLEGLQLEIAG